MDQLDDKIERNAKTDPASVVTTITFLLSYTNQKNIQLDLDQLHLQLLQ